MSATVWRSERLVYLDPEAADEVFLTRMSQDPLSFTQAAPFIPRPNGETYGKKSREWLEKQLVGVMLYLPGKDKPEDPEKPDSTRDEGPIQKIEPKGTPLGFICLMQSDDNRFKHHRNAEIGVTLDQAFHGKGYGSEAIEWVLRWGFRFAGLHRISIGTFSYNKGAVKLYRRLGFTQEGVARDSLWFDDAWHDTITLAMLEDEWREREKAKGSKGMAEVVQRA